MQIDVDATGRTAVVLGTLARARQVVVGVALEGSRAEDVLAALGPDRAADRTRPW
jgi:hypothetical protein